ncbi:MAG: GPW/gp25 family protein [Bacteroidetes bacterium]|nr:GPW/gp25 family protein [Bacteroidota bacterium]MCB0847378.1 GPW/gp25 family protein [Bacteroidota bacterium]
MADDNAFLGTGWAFPPEFDDSSSGVKMVSAEKDINQSLEILLFTSLRERVMRPNYGCNLKDYQFEPMNSTLLTFVRDLVEDAILYFEPRIRTEKVVVSEADSADAIAGRLIISVDYIIKRTNSRFNFVFNFYENEGIEVPV